MKDLDPVVRRAWWWHRQGLDGRCSGRAPSAVLEQSGWARSVGGVGPYLTLRARSGAGRAAVDAAVAALDIHELPSARGCTYVIPAADFALALRAGRAFADSDMATARKLGVTDAEVDALAEAVAGVLGTGALGPDEIRKALGGAVRSLGAAGVKRGVSSTLPLALGRLQASGAIRRLPANGRLDQQRYRYARWVPPPLAGPAVTQAEVHTELASRFFTWIGPARLSEFQWFSGMGVKAARAAIAPLALSAVDAAGEWLLHTDDVDAFRTFRVAREPQFALVSSLDAITHLRRNVADLIDGRDSTREAFGEKGATYLGGLSDLPNHAIFDRGRLIGLWEYDPGASSIAWCTFGVRDKRLEAAVSETEAFVRDELGDARSFSLDSPESRASRIAAIRRAASTARASGT